MTRAISLLRLVLGGWYLFAGINWFTGWFPQPGKDSLWFLHALAASGLFSFMKLFQVGFGLCLIANRFVPAALAGLMPITMVIAYNDIVLESSLVYQASGFAILAANALLILAYSRYFVPLWTMRSRASGLPDLGRWQADREQR